jgi:hypothetical protein
MVSFLDPSQLRAKIAAGFKGKLLVGSLTRVSGTTVDEYGDVIPGATQTFVVNGLVDSYNDVYRTQASIPETDSKIILIAGLSEVEPQKDDKIAAIHELRVEVGARRFKVKANCTNLIRQMKVGMWRDEKHTDFQRSEGLGHLDGVAAAIYFNRSIDRKLNPWPHNYGFHRESHFITQQRVSVAPDSSEAAIAAVFGGKGRI